MVMKPIIKDKGNADKEYYRFYIPDPGYLAHTEAGLKKAVIVLGGRYLLKQTAKARANGDYMMMNLYKYSKRDGYVQFGRIRAYRWNEPKGEDIIEFTGDFKTSMTLSEAKAYVKANGKLIP